MTSHWPDGAGYAIRVFTTRPDTLWGATFMVLAPEHPLVPQITTPEQLDAVENYITRAQRETEIERQAEGREKTGVWTGAYATNPVNGKPIPIWISDYVLMGYGTGAIMAVPAHDQRDFEFARKFGLPIIPVYQEPGQEIDGAAMTAATTDKGVLVNSGPFDGLAYSKETVGKVGAWLKEQGIGEPVVTYKLRDWLISRQRYWGAPIPIIHCPTCGEVPVPEDQLPVALPDVENYQPSGTGESPLATIPEFVNTNCPTCGGPARRETDTMGGFACSSWYFLRFADPHNADAPFSKEAVNYWLPVDTYAGGAEHAVMHLLYARFWTKALHDAGLLDFVEPFTTLRNQGMMLAWTPGRKPAPNEDAEGEETDEQIEDWKVAEAGGARPLSRRRDHLALGQDVQVLRQRRHPRRHGGAVRRGLPARLRDVRRARSRRPCSGARRAFAARPSSCAASTPSSPSSGPAFRLTGATRLDGLTDKEKALRRKTHQTITRVADDLENFRFNTAVAGLMEWTNAMYDVAQRSRRADVRRPWMRRWPCSSRCWPPSRRTWPTNSGRRAWARPGSSTRHPGRRPTPNVAKNEEITLVVQINGKVRDKLTAPADADNAALEALALASPRVREQINGSYAQESHRRPRQIGQRRHLRSKCHDRHSKSKHGNRRGRDHLRPAQR